LELFSWSALISRIEVVEEDAEGVVEVDAEEEDVRHTKVVEVEEEKEEVKLKHSVYFNYKGRFKDKRTLLRAS
jgi:hypothetical protein